MSKSSGFLSCVILLAITGVSGCGEIAYKTGAGAESLRADRNACEQGGKDKAGYLECMRGKGWIIADSEGGADGPALPRKGGGDAPGAAAEAHREQTGAPPPPEHVRVQGWARFGGGGPGNDIADCVVTLGPANQPDTVNHVVTRALLSCMREKGWRAL